MGVCKVIYDGNTLIDLTQDTVTPADLVKGKTTHNANGDLIIGTYEGGGGSSGAVQEKTITPLVTPQIVKPDDDYDYLSQVNVRAISYIEAENEAGGMTATIGNGEGQGVSSQVKDVTPTSTAQVITPDNGYDFLSRVNVSAISYSEIANEAGGMTVIIGGAA